MHRDNRCMYMTHASIYVCFSVFGLGLYCERWSCRCSCMGSVSVSACICCMLVFCVNPVAVPNAAFCTTCSLLILVEDAREDHNGRGILQSRSHDCLVR